MPSPKPIEEENEALPGLTAIAAFTSARKAHEAGLAVLAAKHCYWVYPQEGNFLLAVRSEYAPQMSDEIRHLEMANRNWPPMPLRLSLRHSRFFPTLSLLVLLVIVFILQSIFPQIKELGANDSLAVVNHKEYWRIFTAIFLHADLAHLVGNLIGIGLFGYLACRYLGSKLAWIVILSSAALSNLTNVWIHQDELYRSLGASTAVFAALGLLAGYPLGAYLKARTAINYKEWLVPLLGGCVVFAWMGVSDGPVDVPGHLWGFLYGAAASLLLARKHAQSDRKAP